MADGKSFLLLKLLLVQGCPSLEFDFWFFSNIAAL